MLNKIRNVGRGWRTIIVNGVTFATSTGAVAIAALASDTQDLNTVLGQFITPTRAAVAVSGLTLVNVLLRIDTHGPVGNNPPPP
jgi:hypothetical protein